MVQLAADAVFHNGHLITLDDATRSATAFAIADGKIVFVGSDADALMLVSEGTIKTNLRGKTVVPGFCDAHIHLHWYGVQKKTQADLVGSVTIDDILMRLEAQRKKSDTEWIRGHGFDQEKLPGANYPTRRDLDKISKERPIIVSRVCGHAAVVNTAALEWITDTERASGNAETGLYTENDIIPFYRAIPDPSEKDAEAAVLAAQDDLLRTGITSVQTLLDTPEQMGTYARLRRKGLLKIRICGMPPQATTEILHRHGIATTFGDDQLRFGAAKLFSDGSLGARTALLAAPYADDPTNPENLGIRIYPPDELKTRCHDAQNRGFQLAIHAIGDQAVRESLDALEYALDADAVNDNIYHRHRIEHASILPPDLLERMAARKIVAVVQPQFVTSDIWTGERVGANRAAWAYPFRTMLNAGIPLALSSDCPVEKSDAFACLASVVGRAAWSPHETLTPLEAIRAYCLGGAYAGHYEDKLGSLTVGKFADFVILSDNPLPMAASELRNLKAEAVYIGGKSDLS